MGWLRVLTREVTVRDKSLRMEWLDFPDVVAVLPFTDDGRIVLVEQYRAPVDRRTLEVPAGAAHRGEDPEVAARRELAEETGYRAGRLESLGAYYPAIGYSAERITLFVARDLTPGETCFDDGEEITVHLCRPPEVAEMIHRGQICDSKSLLAFLLWEQERRLG